MASLEETINTKDTDITEQEIITEDDVGSKTISSDEESDSTDDDDGDEFKKFEQDNNMDLLLDYHPEIKQISYKELDTLSKISRDDEGIIIDPLHQTLPLLTRYEKARILGLRAKQINDGSEPLITTTQDMIDGLTIAKLEFEQKKLPFIIRRPLPNGASEYWPVHDLQDLD